jgi:lysophospholipase L1-like esterase
LKLSYDKIIKSEFKMIKKEHLLDPHYKHRTSLFEVFPKTKGNVVFLGDSITEMCEWQEFFPEKRVLNRGISGDSIYGVLDRLDKIIELMPEKVFLTIGVNDLQRRYDPNEVIRSIEEIVDKLITSCNCKVYIQSILPVIEQKLTTGIKNSEIDYVNKELSHFATRNNIEFLDNNSQMKDKTGNLKEELSSDGLHLNGEAYMLWATNIRLKVIE